MPNFAVWSPTTVNFFCALTHRVSATSGGPKFGNLSPWESQHAFCAYLLSLRDEAVLLAKTSLIQGFRWSYTTNLLKSRLIPTIMITRRTDSNFLEFSAWRPIQAAVDAEFHCLSAIVKTKKEREAGVAAIEFWRG